MKQKIITTVSIKGGTGKSTLTVLIGRHLAETGRRVLIVDLDPQASATDRYCREETADELAGSCVYHLLTERASLGEVIRPGVLGLDVVPSAPVLGLADLELASDPGALLRFRSSILEGGHDVILIDCQPTLSAGTQAALYAADLVLSPCQLDRWTLQGLGMLEGAVIKAKRTTGRDLPVLCVPSIVTPKEADELKEALKGQEGRAVSRVYIPRSVTVRRAIVKAGLPNKTILESIADLATEITEG